MESPAIFARVNCGCKHTRLYLRTTSIVIGAPALRCYKWHFGFGKIRERVCNAQLTSLSQSIHIGCLRFMRPAGTGMVEQPSGMLFLPLYPVLQAGILLETGRLS